MHVKAGGPETRVSVGGRRCRGSAATVASGKHEEVLSECETQRASRSCRSECLANKQHETLPLTELWPRGNLVSSCCGPTCFLSSTCLYRYCSGCGHARDLKNSHSWSMNLNLCRLELFKAAQFWFAVLSPPRSSLVMLSLLQHDAAPCCRSSDEDVGFMAADSQLSDWCMEPF